MALQGTLGIRKRLSERCIVLETDPVIFICSNITTLQKKNKQDQKGWPLENEASLYLRMRVLMAESEQDLQ